MSKQTVQSTNPLHQSQLQQLEHFVTSDQPMLLLTGQHYSGKTQLLKRFIIKTQLTSCIIRIQGEPHLRPSRLAHILCQHWHDMSHNPQCTLDAVLMARQKYKQPHIVIIDNAHALPLVTLGTLSHFATHHSHKTPTLHIVLSGTNDLSKKMYNLSSQSWPCITLQPLNKHQTQQYINFYLSQHHHTISQRPNSAELAEIHQRAQGLLTLIKHFIKEWLNQPQKVDQNLHLNTQPPTIEAHHQSNFWNKHAIKALASTGIIAIGCGVWLFNDHIQQATNVPSPPQAHISTKHSMKPMATWQPINQAPLVNQASHRPSLQNALQPFAHHITEINRQTKITAKPQNHATKSLIQKRYTLQLMSSLHQQDAVKFIQQHHLHSHARITINQINKINWYAVIYGEYDNLAAARKARFLLPQSIQHQQPWVRSLPTTAE